MAEAAERAGRGAAPGLARPLPARPRVPLPQPSRRLDPAALLGLLLAFGLVGIAVAYGGSFRAFIDPASIMLVIGGTLGVTTICFTLADVGRAAGASLGVLGHGARDVAAAARWMMFLADTARTQGVLALDRLKAEIAGDPFLSLAIGLVVDGTPPQEIDLVLQQELAARRQRARRCAEVLRRAAEIAPAMGLIGTLVGLVQMLGNLDDPQRIGPAMAIALLTTFYGAVLAYMLFIPLAAKIDKNANDDQLVDEVYLLGAGSIARQENPRRLEMLLNAALPPEHRIAYFD
ncbi:MAG: MotA/TolQ/ExbB proton channel family protein [Thalassobaculales bacterium]